MSNFIFTLMSSYTLSMTSVKVALVPVPGANGLTFAAGFLNSITSLSTLSTYLNDVKNYYNDFDDAGQILQA